MQNIDKRTPRGNTIAMEWARRISRLSKESELIVLLAMGADEAFEAEASYSDLAKALCVSTSSVRRMLADAEAHGVVRKIPQQDEDGARLPNRWRLAVES